MEKLAHISSSSFKGPIWKFPANPADLLKDLPRNRKGIIYTSDHLRIRPEKHLLEPNQIFSPRHHGQHYPIETRRDPTKSWSQKNIEIIKPKNYKPGDGTGFLPDEYFPGVE